MDGMLSQEEMDALLSDGDGNAEDTLSEMEKDTVGELSNISMGTAATTLSSLLNQKVSISTPVIEYATWDDLIKNYDRPCVFLQISYKEGLSGSNILILKESDVKIITDLMMGGDGNNTPDILSELHLSAISEAMNQMMGTAATSLSSMLGIKIDIRPPIASIVDLNSDVNLDEFSGVLKNRFLKISFTMKVGELIDSVIMQLFPIDFAKNLCGFVSGETFQAKNGSAAQADNNKETANVSTGHAPADQMQQDEQMYGMGQQQNMGQPYVQPNPQMQYGNAQANPQMQYGGMQMNNMGYAMPMQDVNVQNARFQAFTPNVSALAQKENIELIMDVPLEVTAELGRTSKSIQDILEFAPGTIIELDKIAGEPIDVLVNGKLIAKGEVVVIEESFGVRVTEIIK